MQVSLKRLRIGLLTSAGLLVALLVGYISYGRYSLVKHWKDLAAKRGIIISHQTDGYTYSQSLAGRTIFTLHAAKAIQLDDNKLSLHDVVFTFYGQKDGAIHHVYGSEFDYDQKSGVAHAIGEVHMDIQAPQGLGAAGKTGHPVSPAQPQTQPASGADAPHEGAGIIHVKTSGLVYAKNLGVAATDQLVEFQYGGIQGTSQGAEFDTNESILHLLADVKADGIVRGQPMRMTAVKADLDRDGNTGDFIQPVIYSRDKTARSQHALIYFRQDGSISNAEANGAVSITSGTQQVNSARMDASFGTTSLPQNATLSGGVTLTDTSAVKPMHGAASTMQISFDALGNPSVIDAVGSANLSMMDRQASPQGLRRDIHADHIVTTFVPVQNPSAGKQASQSHSQSHQKTRLSEVHATGSAHVIGDALTAATAKSPAQLKTTQIAADDLYFEFAAGANDKARLDNLHGLGHTQLQQDAPGGEQQISTGDNLQMAFVPAVTGSKPGSENDRISSAVQTGHVIIHSRPAARPTDTSPPQVTNASADRGAYDGATNKLTLTGNAYINDPNTELKANTVVLDQTTGDADAHGNILATLLNANNASAKKTSPGANRDGAQVTHVMSANATLHHNAKQAEFHGTDALPARLWQGASQVEAANLYFDGDRHTLAARPAAPNTLIHAVFSGDSSPAPKGPTAGSKASRPPSATDVVRVSSQRMDYSDLQREAVFTGAVHLDSPTGNVLSQRAVAFLTPAAPKSSVDTKSVPPAGSAGQPNPFNGSLDRVIVTGGVQLEQPGRHGTGDQLLYTAATGNYVLTGTPGHPPRVVDAKQGTITGSTLLFSDSGSTIVVSGTPATQQAEHTRVHTETDIPRQ